MSSPNTISETTAQHMGCLDYQARFTHAADAYHCHYLLARRHQTFE